MRTKICGVLILFLGIARVASAEPVTLTSGEIFTYWDGSDTTFNVAASGFAATGTSTGGGFTVSFNAGDTVSLAHTLVVRGVTFMPNGSVTIGGQRQQGSFDASFQFTATPFVAGQLSGLNVVFTAPFSGQGLVQLFASPNDSHPLISQDVIGSGVLSVDARQTEPGHYVTLVGGGLLTLTFEPPGSTTPEPASLLLLATGLAPLMLRRRLKKR